MIYLIVKTHAIHQGRQFVFFYQNIHPSIRRGAYLKDMANQT